MFTVFVQELGGNTIREFFDQVFFLKYKFLAGSVAVLSISTGAAIADPFGDWVEAYIYAPKLTIYMCLLATVSEWVTGIAKAKFIDKEEFDLIKGASIVPKVIAVIWALSTTFHYGQAEDMMWIPSSVSLFLFGMNFLKAAYHLSKLKILPEGFVEFMEDKFKMSRPNENKPEGNSTDPQL